MLNRINSTKVIYTLFMDTKLHTHGIWKIWVNEANSQEQDGIR